MSKPKQQKPSEQQLRFDAVMFHPDLTLPEAYVLLALSTWQYGDRTSCFPSIANLAKRARMSERSLQRRLADLKEKGLLDYYPKPGYRADRAPYEFVVDWPKLKAAKRTPDAKNEVSDCQERGVSLSGTGCQAVARSYKKETTKRNWETAGTESRLPPPGSGLTAGEGGRSSSGAGVEQPLTPAKHPERFLQWLQERQERLPHLPPFGSADEAAWAKVWDANTEFHEDGGAFYLLDAIDGNNYWSGREGDPPFLMKPQFLLGKHEGEERWRLVMLGNFHSLGRTYQEIIDAKARLLIASVDDFLNSHEKPKEAMQEPKLLLRSLAHGGRFECNPYLVDEFRLLLVEEIEHREAKKARREADLAAFLAREDIVAAPEPETYSKPSPAETEEGLAPDIADLLVDL